MKLACLKMVLEDGNGFFGDMFFDPLEYAQVANQLKEYIDH